MIFADNDAAKGWEELCRQSAANTFEAWHRLRTDPAPRLNTRRQHRLRNTLAHGTRAGRQLPQYQIEVTGSGRVWYLLDAENRTVWVVLAGTGHPKETE
ncbi:hypothetical protein ACQPZF_01840 [Actinosynnema sp. CS-041913]|uniref:hypothetical protein n=1 Tax=Actinosynnema sp. CS-041913 TaxID=3239917 RepID=UPI003D8C2434